MNFKFRLIIALVAAVLCAGAFAAYGSEVRAEAENVRSEAIAQYGGEVIELVCCTRTLEVGETISAGDVTLREWLVDLAPEGALTSLDDCVGKTLTAPAAKGAPLTDLNFRDATDAADIPAGYVAVSVPISDKLGITSSVAPGAGVVAWRVTSDGSSLVAAQAQVLAAPGAAATSLANQTITLAVRPADVAQVLEASSAGELRLVLPAADVDAIPTDESSTAPDEVAAVSDAATEAVSAQASEEEQ